MQQSVEAAFAMRVAVPQGYAGMTRKAAGVLDMSRRRQLFETAQQQVTKRRRVALFRPLLRCVHQPTPSPAPRYCFASALIISGVHGGS